MAPLSIHDDRKLLFSIAAGDEKAFEQLYERYADTIYGVAFAYTKSAPFSEEIVQDVFLKIWLKREGMASIENLDDYLFIVARNQIITGLRKKIKERDYLKELAAYFKENTITPEQELLFKESRELINQAMAILPPQQKLVYQMAREQGLKLDDIAIQLGLSRNTVKNHLARAIQFMREFIRNNSEGSLLLLALLFLSI